MNCVGKLFNLEKFIAQSAVETLCDTVLPWTARLDVYHLDQEKVGIQERFCAIQRHRLLQRDVALSVNLDTVFSRITRLSFSFQDFKSLGIR